ncbi:efflux transporter, RND family, MFP subunit [Magnetococcus marinus MC-1]|uniref:Efflux transporter, RND family, MFP subunit n=1 Tax=Magnetococcus marinus (strain ATCC BAA-1437 / JCM 17883 / MC-1) TaxID=156889 RepID=A0L8V9_MAGMM|nr:HlyD family efflux transporter periplasmic adaptor subunit [Magnetococcus marinus]ABK44402.1 efflux transporter, RND family, MFP subunit [Magnetococcus marinus MC-1]
MNRLKALRTLLFPLLILAGGAWGIRLIGSMDRLPPTPSSLQAQPVVTVQRVEPSWQAPQIILHGEVRSDRQLRLMTRIQGRVAYISPALKLGGAVKQGALLLSLEDREARLHLQAQQARTRTAELELEIEAGRQKIAKQDWAVLRLGEVEQASDLALRLPHLGVVRQKLEMARIELAQAQQELSYTKLYAPFDALVVSKDVAMGQWLKAGEEIARLLDSQRFLVHLPISSSQFALLDQNKLKLGEGPKLFLRPAHDLQAPPSVAQLTGFVGELLAPTRRLVLLAQLDNPMQNRGTLLLPGSFVQAQFTGQLQPHIYAIPPQARHNGDRIWTVETLQNPTLRSYGIHPLWQQGEVWYTTLTEAGQKPLLLVTSPLSLPVEGQSVSVTQSTALSTQGQQP